MDENKILRYEVNFLTGTEFGRSGMIQSIETEFDFIQMCQGMIKPFGTPARVLLDRFIALSLRKMFFGGSPLLLAVCPDFKMPPLSGKLYNCPGYDNEMKFFVNQPSIKIKPYDEWIPLHDWLNEKIAWIAKGADDIPDAYGDGFFKMIEKRIGNNTLRKFFERKMIVEDGNNIIVWEINDPTTNKSIVYNYLRENGYYDLTIKRLIKTIADKKGAHADAIKIDWVEQSNMSTNWNCTAISCFATQMIYAATKQISELKEYMDINPMIEVL